MPIRSITFSLGSVSFRSRATIKPLLLQDRVVPGTDDVAMKKIQ